MTDRILVDGVNSPAGGVDPMPREVRSWDKAFVEPLYRRRICGRCGGRGFIYTSAPEYDGITERGSTCRACYSSGYVYEPVDRDDTLPRALLKESAIEQRRLEGELAGMRTTLWFSATYRHSREQYAGHNGSGFTACRVAACREAAAAYRSTGPSTAPGLDDKRM